MYDTEFEIVNGSTTAEAIDEEYALTFVMPKCKIRLSEKDCRGTLHTLTPIARARTPTQARSHTCASFSFEQTSFTVMIFCKVWIQVKWSL